MKNTVIVNKEILDLLIERYVGMKMVNHTVAQHVEEHKLIENQLQIKKVQRTDLIVEIKGGLITNVTSNTKAVSMNVVDYDTESTQHIIPDFVIENSLDFDEKLISLEKELGIE